MSHSQPYQSQHELDSAVQNLQSNGYRRVPSSNVSAFEFHVEGPHGIDPSKFGGPTVWTLYWSHPEDQPRGCQWPSCAKNL